MLYTYPGTLIVVSHDTELLRNYIDILWHIDHGKIHVFSGNYDDYTREIRIKRTSVEQELSRLNFQRKDTHHTLMKEQQRAAKSKMKGQKSIDQRKWPTILSKSKASRAEETSGRKKLAIDHKKYELSKQLSNLRLPEIIVPKFSLNSSEIGNYTLVSISNGTTGYQIEQNILKDITLSLSSKDRIAITGNNGSGKSTLVKAILADQKVIKTSHWHIPKQEDIGYLDQHYETLSPEKSVLEFMLELVPSWSHAEVRKHLNDFLFRKNEEVNALISQLSGGEKARLSLAKIAAKTPKLLILDEITNNLDFETKAHVTKVLKEYPGAMIIISHDEDLLREIEICDT